jgi:hypothetical protein
MHSAAGDMPTAEHAGSGTLPAARWVKSSYSGPTGGNCVEVGGLGDGRVAVRDSRRAAGPALVFTARQWDDFIGRAKAGELRAARLPLPGGVPMNGQCRGRQGEGTPVAVASAS